MRKMHRSGSGRNLLCLAAPALLATAGQVPADEPVPPGVALIELLAAGTIRCHFTPPPDATGTPDPIAIAYRDISLRNGTADGGDALLGGEVGIIPASRGLHFYEFNEAGDLSLVTVYASLTDDGRYAATLSRHHSANGRPLPTQHAGACTAGGAGPPA